MSDSSPRYQPIVINLADRVLRAGTVRSGQDAVDIIAVRSPWNVRLAIARIAGPSACFWAAAKCENDIRSP